MSETVFITGANSGVGLATAKLFANNGWNVVATARNPSGALELNNLARQHPHTFLIVALDVLSPDTFKPALDASVDRFGKVDCLVNNAGYGQFGPVEGLDMEDYRRQFEVNVFGPIGLTKFFIPHFRSTGDSKRPPRILYVSSGAAHFGLPLSSAYCASKGALDCFVESVAYEFAQLSPSIIVKLVPIHGGIKSTNFSNSSNSVNVLATEAPNNIKERYGQYAHKVFAVFAQMSALSMAVEVPAIKIYEAATDGLAKLRYFECGPGRGDFLKARMKGAKDGENLDEVDERYVGYMRDQFA